MDASSRRWVARLIRVGLVILAMAVVASWIGRRTPERPAHMRVETDVPAPDSLRAGDVQIFNSDSTVDVILSGDRILAGLSPKTVHKVRTELGRPNSDSGLGGSIASLVKKTVAGAIDTHMEFSLADVRDIRYDEGRLYLELNKGGDHLLFGDTKVNGERRANTFRADEAQRFIEAVRARKRELGHR